jgi:hypothetical protein
MACVDEAVCAVRGREDVKPPVDAVPRGTDRAEIGHSRE